MIMEIPVGTRIPYVSWKDIVTIDVELVSKE